MSAAHFQTPDIRAAFVAQYNAYGLPVVEHFESGNCCITVQGGEMLTVSDSPYGTQFPAFAGSGESACNPPGGYRGHVRFFLLPSLAAGGTPNPSLFGSKRACKVHAVFCIPNREPEP
jgi:hypothetical protein